MINNSSFNILDKFISFLYNLYNRILIYINNNFVSKELNKIASVSFLQRLLELILISTFLIIFINIQKP